MPYASSFSGTSTPTWWRKNCDVAKSLFLRENLRVPPQQVRVGVSVYAPLPKIAAFESALKDGELKTAQWSNAPVDAAEAATT
jgi:hypothetical protein